MRKALPRTSGTFKLDDGVSFVHFAVIDTADGSNPLVSLPAFERFQTDLAERCVEMPHTMNVFPVDGYRFPSRSEALHGEEPRHLGYSG
jgi:hypothetical protein